MLLARVAQHISQKGLFSTFHLACERLYEHYREWALGIDTRGHLHWHELGDDPSCKRYQPVPYRCLDAALAQMSVDPAQGVLLDYGSGKGRVILQAARRPYRKVIGVERSAELCSVARENVRKSRRYLQCREIEILETDARAYAVPAEVTVVFLFNPFAGPVLAAVLHNIHHSLLNDPRKLLLFYICPQRPDNPFAGYAWLKLRQTLPCKSREVLSSFFYEFEPGR